MQYFFADPDRSKAYLKQFYAFLKNRTCEQQVCEQQFAEALRTGDATKFGEKENLDLENISELLDPVTLPPPKEQYYSKPTLRASYQNGFSLGVGVMVGDQGVIGSVKLDDAVVREKVEADGRWFRKILGKDIDSIEAVQEACRRDGKPSECSDLELGSLYATISADARSMISGDAVAKLANENIKKNNGEVGVFFNPGNMGQITRAKLREFFEYKSLYSAYLKLIYDVLARSPKSPSNLKPVVNADRLFNPP
jgi:hypothetical protein